MKNNCYQGLRRHMLGCWLLECKKLRHEVITEMNNQWVSVRVIPPDACDVLAFQAQAIYNYLTNL